MTISDRLRSVQEMKNLQAELKTIQEEKKSRKVQLEPLQEGAEKMLTEIDAAKGQIEQVGLESGELLKEHITVQIVETVAEKSTQVKSQVEEISSRFQELEKSVQEAHTT
jgi:chromosome segregation ATPase